MKTFAVIGICTLLPSAVFADGSKVISDYLMSAVDGLDKCSYERLAIEDTVKRLDDVKFPQEGKFVLVNIAAGFLTAFEDGEPIIEMKTIVGKPENKTPKYITEITSVRINPTWTAPSSIVKEEGWKTKITNDVDFFVRNKFEFRDSERNLMSLSEAVNNPEKISSWIQSPGPLNALGQYRFNIKSSQDVYLHDTRDRENFYDGSPIALSHGCVRIEKPDLFASWALDWEYDKVQRYVKSGSSFDFPIEDDIPLVMGYYAAWPSYDGQIYVYDDIYDEVKSCAN